MASPMREEKHFLDCWTWFFSIGNWLDCCSLLLLSCPLSSECIFREEVILIKAAVG